MSTIITKPVENFLNRKCYFQSPLKQLYQVVAYFLYFQRTVSEKLNLSSKCSKCKYSDIDTFREKVKESEVDQQPGEVTI